MNKLLSKRHSLINTQPLISGFQNLVNTFLSDLDALKKTQQKLTDHDHLKEEIENLFNGCVGTAPENQAAIDEIYKEADNRFKIKIPPGYRDSDKDKKDEPDEYLHGGLIYKRKFGDYLIWRQVLTHAKENGVKQLILVTDDEKEDWWEKINSSDGPKTIGPRPELIEEARLKGAVDTFLMYKPEGFLDYAKEFLNAQVSEETLKEVRDISIVKLQEANIERDIFKGKNSERANLERDILEGAYLEGVYLEGANLIEANLVGAHLEGANLGRANLQRANLEGAYLEGAYLERAYLIGASLRGANLERAYIEGAHLEEAHLEGVNLEGAYLGGADLEKAYLGGANLGGVYLGGANLVGANLEGANFERANLIDIGGLTMDQLSTVKTLYNVIGLELTLLKQVQKNYPHLLEKPY